MTQVIYKTFWFSYFVKFGFLNIKFFFINDNVDEKNYDNDTKIISKINFYDDLWVCSLNFDEEIQNYDFYGAKFKKS